MKKILSITLFLVAFLVFSQAVVAQTPTIIPTQESEATTSTQVEEEAKPSPTPRPDITQRSEETLEPLEQLLQDQQLGPMWPYNPVKYAIRGSISAGVPANTIVLLLLLPVVAALIAAARHLIGLRGFGIFLPAALSVVFVATGPLLGIGLFLVIVVASTFIRYFLRKTKIRLQYLPRMALILLFVVFGVLSVLFAAPLLRQPGLANVSIFPVLILVLLAEDFTRVQMGKSGKTAINLTAETLVLALVSFFFLTMQALQEFALLNPEILLISVAIFDFILGKYVGLRFLEYWRFRKLISS